MTRRPKPRSQLGNCSDRQSRLDTIKCSPLGLPVIVLPVPVIVVLGLPVPVFPVVRFAPIPTGELFLRDPPVIAAIEVGSPGVPPATSVLVAEINLVVEAGAFLPDPVAEAAPVVIKPGVILSQFRGGSEAGKSSEGKFEFHRYFCKGFIYY